ncbi:polysaccharide deacetylase family protein [Paenibacillus macerans]|uniref:polysaccharide deacetylase family protein n=1 Tax=Paenibacillus macerans TaxID=44252 RepID=UPI00203E6A5D|nr:polysaccharide deacetylase family protein [Paenibacillus macerans]MCM3698202.1 polysaccharide deacetylase family protein [Paenibacillus macerans]
MTRLFHKKILLVAAACVLLSSCGQPDSSTGQSDSNARGEGNAANAAVSAPESQETASSPEGNGIQTAPEAPQDGISGSGSEEAADTVEKPELLYHINKAYNVVPNEEGTDKKVVLLTFDDGPKEQEMIEGLIDTLDKHGAKAIFFVNGYRVKAHPELLQLIHDRGQIVGNHSWDHIDLKKEKEANMRQQIEDVQAIVKETIGETPRFFRPPFGSGNDVTHQIADDNGLIYMTWSNGSLDWDSKNKNKPDAVIQNVLEQLHAGSNILMHELPWTVEALDELLTKLEDKGYGFVDPASIGPDPAAD